MGASYRYRAVDAAGRKHVGNEAAVSQLALTQGLESRGLLVLEVSQNAEPAAGAAKGSLFGRRREVLEVTRALASLLPAGLSLSRALSASANMASGEVALAVQNVRTRIERGESLAASIGEYSHLFSPLYVGLIRAGERSGDLAAAFKRLATQLERDEQLRSKLLSISIYPLLLASAGGIAVVVLLFFVMPKFVELLQGTGATLPASTAALLAVSAALRRYWMLLLLVPVVVGMLAVWMRTNEEGKRALGTLLLRLPLIRQLRQHSLGARFARLMGVLLSGGAPLLNALDDTLESLADPHARDEVIRIRGRVREGVALNRALAEGTLFPPMLNQLVAVGEESGRLQDFLLKAAEILEEKTERVLQRLVSLAEPAMILVFGGLVGFVALSLMQAIYSVNAGSFR